MPATARKKLSADRGLRGLTRIFGIPIRVDPRNPRFFLSCRIFGTRTLDTSFVDPAVNSDVLSAALQAEGKVLIGGFFASVGGETRNRIARLNSCESGPAWRSDEAWIVGECCTLLMARRRPHLIPRFLELTERSKSLSVIVADDALYTRTKTFMRRHLDHEYSFADCASFVVMEERSLHEALTHDAHFTEAGKVALLR